MPVSNAACTGLRSCRSCALGVTVAATPRCAVEAWAWRTIEGRIQSDSEGALNARTAVGEPSVRPYLLLGLHALTNN